MGGTDFKISEPERGHGRTPFPRSWKCEGQEGGAWTKAVQPGSAVSDQSAPRPPAFLAVALSLGTVSESLR